VKLISFASPLEFLDRTQDTLQSDESLNSLILGIALTLQRDSEVYKRQSYLAAVEDGDSLELISLMTPPHNLLVAGEGKPVGEAAHLIAVDLAEGGWPVPGVLGPTPLADAFAHAWQLRTGEEASVAMEQRLYSLHEVLSPPAPPGYLRPTRASDIPLVARWIEAFHEEITPGHPIVDPLEKAQRRTADGSLHLWERGQPVSMAGWARPTGRGITIGLVYTPPERRGQGYATAAVATLSQQLLDGGYDTISLFTDLANPTSNAIYQRIGFRVEADFRDYRFMS
jgi:predicted GNAT family acetyltransferase